MMTPLRLTSVYRSLSDSMEKPAAVEPPDLPPLDIDDLPSKAHDSAPPSVNDQVRLEFMVEMVTTSPNEILPFNSYNYKFVFFLESSIYSYEH